MSALVPTVARVSQNPSAWTHPWRRLRSLSHITLLWHDRDHDEAYGITDFAADTISLRSDLDQAGRRSTLLHECLHVERGPALAGVLAAREELRVRREAARILLPNIRAVGEALAWAHTLEEAAGELWVDVDTLRDRLDFLHPAELHYLRARLDDGQDARTAVGDAGDVGAWSA